MSEAFETALKKAVSALEQAEIPYMLGGGYAAYAWGGPPAAKDIDLMVKPEHAERAQEALVAAGMRPERPAEQWLLKAWDGEVLVDLIFEPSGLEITAETLAKAEQIYVEGMRVNVMALEDVLVTKLMSLDEHTLDYGHLVAIARAVREQIDWQRLRERTSDSPYAGAFFTLAHDLGIVDAGAGRTQRPTVRIS